MRIKKLHELDFLPIQIIAAQNLIRELSYIEEPEFSEGINRELCLSWIDRDIKVMYEVTRRGAVVGWIINIKDQKYEGEI